MQIDTRSSHFMSAYTTNVTTAGTSITNPAATTTAPVPGPTTGIIQMGDQGMMSANGLELIPFGVGTATNTFLLSVFALDAVKALDPTTNKTLWFYWPLATFTCTLCTYAGVANTDVNASQLFCGTITLGVGNANVSNEIVSPTGNLVASITLDTKGAKYVYLALAMNNSATSANCLFRRL